MAKDNGVIIKRDTKENWQKSRYIPKENVIVIMDYDDGSIGLMVGDGLNNVNKLPDLLSKKELFADSIVDEEDVLIL